MAHASIRMNTGHFLVEMVYYFPRQNKGLPPATCDLSSSNLYTVQQDTRSEHVVCYTGSELAASLFGISIQALTSQIKLSASDTNFQGSQTWVPGLGSNT